VTTGDSSHVKPISSGQSPEATTSSSGTTADANKNPQVPRDVMDCSKFQVLTLNEISLATHLLNVYFITGAYQGQCFQS